MKRQRPKLLKISEEMKAWSSALADEVQTWPEVSVRPMFGLLGIYRADRIFAVLPRTRTMEKPDSVGLRVPSSNYRLQALAKRDPRVEVSDMSNAKWWLFSIAEDKDLRGALDWLNRAYKAAR